MIVGTGPVAGAPVLVRLPRWVARPVIAGHMADDVTWAGEGSRPFDLRPPPHNDQVHRTTARILIVFPMSAVSRQSLLLDAPVAPATGSSKDASHASISTCRSRSARLLLPPAAIEDRRNRGVCHQEYPQWGRPLQDHHQIFPALLRQDRRRRARQASVGCIATAAGSLRAQRGKNVCANMRNECHLPQRISQPLEQAEHADEGWVHVHDTPDDTTQ